MAAQPSKLQKQKAHESTQAEARTSRLPEDAPAL
jgi:hypothetical protein